MIDKRALQNITVSPATTSRAMDYLTKVLVDDEKVINVFSNENQEVIFTDKRILVADFEIKVVTLLPLKEELLISNSVMLSYKNLHTISHSIHNDRLLNSTLTLGFTGYGYIDITFVGHERKNGNAENKVFYNLLNYISRQLV